MSLNSSKTILSHIHLQRIVNLEENRFLIGQKEFQFFPFINLSKAQYRIHQSRYILSLLPE
jgi:hypothetical protein